MTLTIGARVLKTGVAVAVALWVGKLIGLESPMLAAVAAIFTIQPSIYRSWLQVLEQLQSNVMGAVAAVAAAWLLGTSPVIVGLVCILVIALCIRLKMEESIGLALVTVVVLMESSDLGWMVALERLAALGTGVVAALVVNVAVAPPRHRPRFVRQVREAQELLARLLRAAVMHELRETVYRAERKRLEDTILKLEKSFQLLAEERVWSKRARARRARLLTAYRCMLGALAKGSALLEATDRHPVAAPSEGKPESLAARQIEVLCGYHEHLMWKWEGKTKPGTSAAAPPEEAAAGLVDFFSKATEGYPPTERARLIAVASALFAYEEQLRRLDRLMDQVLQRTGGDAAAAKAEASG